MVWTLLGVVGLYFGVRNLRSSKRDIDALQKMNGHTFAQYQVMRVIAYGHYRNDLFRLAKHITILAIGVIAMILPNPQSTRVSYTGVAITGGLFTIVLLLILASALDRRQREALEEM